MTKEERAAEAMEEWASENEERTKKVFSSETARDLADCALYLSVRSPGPMGADLKAVANSWAEAAKAWELAASAVDALENTTKKLAISETEYKAAWDLANSSWDMADMSLTRALPLESMSTRPRATKAEKQEPKK